MTSVSVSENPDECRKILKKAVTNCGADINKNPVSITVFRMSCFNDFYSFFCKPWIEKKKTVAVDTKLRLQLKMLLMRVTFQGNFTQVGQGLKKIFFKIFLNGSFDCQK